MPTLVIYRIDADPLGTSDVTILEEYIVDVTDDDAQLEWNDASGPQLDTADLPAGLVGDTTSFQVFETYSGSLGGSTVSFTLLQYSTPTLIVATLGTFDVGDTITGTGSTIVTAPSSDYDTLPDFVCFVAGTLIETPQGPRAIETLSPGDLVLTGHGYAKPIKWVGRRKLSASELAKNPHLAPVEIAPDAIAPGVPARAVHVSPQHRIALGTGASGIALEADAVLAPAQFLTEREGIQTDANASSVDYVHILLDTHEVVNVAGLWSETLFLGDTTLAALSPDARDEITQIFPQLTHSPHTLERTCLPVVTRHEARVALKDFCAFDPHDTEHDLSNAS